MTGTPMSSTHFMHVPRSLLVSILLGSRLPSSMAFLMRLLRNIAACLDFSTGTQKNSFVLTTDSFAVILMIFSRTRKTQNRQQCVSPLNGFKLHPAVTRGLGLARNLDGTVDVMWFSRTAVCRRRGFPRTVQARAGFNRAC